MALLLLGGSKLEEWVAPSFGEVVLRGLVDAYSVSAQESDGWPYLRAKQSA
jgi:hypothetical protein